MKLARASYWHPRESVDFSLLDKIILTDTSVRWNHFVRIVLNPSFVLSLASRRILHSHSASCFLPVAFLLFFPSLHTIAKWSGVPEKFLVSNRLSFPVSLSETIRVRNYPLKTPGTGRSFFSRKKQKISNKCVNDAS